MGSPRGRAQFLDLILERQLASLQIGDFEIVDRWMIHRLVDFPLDVAMLPMQLVKVVGKRHLQSLPSSFLGGTATPVQSLDARVTAR